MKRKIFLLAGALALVVVKFAFSQTVWQKYEGNPVLVQSEYWESGFGVFAPRVLKIDNLYKMWYTGLGDNRLIGLATSEDGIHWTKSPANPVLRTGQSSDFDSQYVQYG